MAQALADAGSALILIARHEEEIDRTVKEIQNTGKKVLAIKADVTKSDDISRVVKRRYPNLKRSTSSSICGAERFLRLSQI